MVRFDQNGADMPKIKSSHKAINKQLNFRVSGELKEKIKNQSTKEGISEGELIRKALKEYIGKKQVILS